MRQVGDRLIPVGVTSGRIQILEEGAEGGNEENSGRRSRRRGQPNGELGQLLHSMGMPMAGQDLEEVRIVMTLCSKAQCSLLSIPDSTAGSYAVVTTGA